MAQRQNSAKTCNMADGNERLVTELELLQAIFPDQVTFSTKRREFSYVTDKSAFSLRLPERYPGAESPEVLSASGNKNDLRDRLKASIAKLPTGEEMLDSIITAFDQLVDQATSDAGLSASDREHQADLKIISEKKTTVIVWLHHLLNTSKRKQVLAPPLSGVSGVSKPGYPGVLIFSGPAVGVHKHVNELKQLNWQAFQVRLESDEEWPFTHGSGVLEVESMKEVVAELGEDKKDVFMQAMRMK